jgi:hypothetical protein
VPALPHGQVLFDLDFAQIQEVIDNMLPFQLLIAVGVEAIENAFEGSMISTTTQCVVPQFQCFSGFLAL